MRRCPGFPGRANAYRGYTFTAVSPVVRISVALSGLQVIDLRLTALPAGRDRGAASAASRY
ncbi:hypothetical protein, partial [Acinetobacter baumannii]